MDPNQGVHPGSDRASDTVGGSADTLQHFPTASSGLRRTLRQAGLSLVANLGAGNPGTCN